MVKIALCDIRLILLYALVECQDTVKQRINSYFRSEWKDNSFDEKLLEKWVWSPFVIECGDFLDIILLYGSPQLINLSVNFICLYTLTGVT